MTQEEIDQIVEKLKSRKRWLDAFTIKHPRVVWAWAVTATVLFALAWIGNKVFC